MPRSTVLVIGGGVGGLTAAHELAERGLQVTVVERRDLLGGKARSIPVPGSGIDGRRDLPGEHGFRFFAGFYRHMFESMSRIPLRDRDAVVFDNLVETDRAQFVRDGRRDIIIPTTFPDTLDDLRASFGFTHLISLGVPPDELFHFGCRMLALLSSSDERRNGELEHLDWWTYIGAATRSKPYQQYLADGMTRRFVAARAREMSARTCGRILLQLMFDFRPGEVMDRVLNQPTNDGWLIPWAEHLRDLGVTLLRNTDAVSLDLDGSRIGGVTVVSPDGRHRLTADHYVLAAPLEVATELATPALRELEPRLDGMDRLVTRWMNGIQFFLTEDAPLVRGHTIFMDAPFGLSAVSQRQFWPGVDFSSFGDGDVGGILSVDISDWSEPGILYGRPAMELTAEQIRAEVWAQMREHLDDGDRELLDASSPRGWFLDPAIVQPNPTTSTNLEPLLINTVGSWDDRPEAVTSIENLFLAGDYVRTFTDLATMEAANESGRRAANGVLDVTSSDEPRCGVWDLQEPALFGPIRMLDRLRYRRREPALTLDRG